MPAKKDFLLLQVQITGQLRQALNLNKDKSKAEKKVAIIGSGPAGLAAAYYLQIYGYSCTVYEKSGDPGGTLLYSIPDDELPKNIIEQEIEIISSMGVKFHYNTLINQEIFNSQIKGVYDAVILATGDINSDNSLTGMFEVSKSGFQVNEKDMSTSVPGGFSVCGSAIRPHKMAVRSVAQGKLAALKSVNNWLQNKEFEKTFKNVQLKV